MPLAKDVAIELRKLADSLDQQPEAQIVRPWIYFSNSYMGSEAKGLFLALAAILPHPLAKVYKGDEIRLEYENPAMSISAYIERSKVCTIIEPQRIIPAVYQCEPLLSESEDVSLAHESIPFKAEMPEAL
jgi:hypothetical protein